MGRIKRYYLVLHVYACENSLMSISIQEENTWHPSAQVRRLTLLWI